MPPKQATNRARGPPKGSKSKQSSASAARPASSNPFESSDDQAEGEPEPEAGEQAEADKSIPKDLLTRVLHELFAKDATRISRDANAAVGKYVDVFVREAIARAAVDKRSGFLEVEDLEKIAPQLLLDL
ncbi:hypothetical protein G6O67_005887 [Ophiocordyceps sinensis]|uniref:CENP-S complex, centromere protein X n=1 Tax=Ophiocordyceps sinensis TaxID=72228 RepID=A0A8H4LX73_9HYPO|nr:hypothetical protein G6O67_005887 [Ophiocordyceps sinensis]